MVEVSLVVVKSVVVVVVMEEARQAAEVTVVVDKEMATWAVETMVVEVTMAGGEAVVNWVEQAAMVAHGLRSHHRGLQRCLCMYRSSCGHRGCS